MGGGRPLAESVRRDLPARLAARADAVVLLGYAQGAAAGLLIAFEGFSTFACAPLLNIHDIVVAPAYRGAGLAGRLLARAEAIARDRGCCKLTLEVLEGNRAARAAYRRSGFRPYELDPAMGRALFWEKPLGG
jgi:GNAT superfamily N-acetyltransferase